MKRYCVQQGQWQRFYDVKTHLVEFGIKDVPCVERTDEDHGIGDSTVGDVLLACHRDVKHDPEDQTRSHLVERLDVE